MDLDQPRTCAVGGSPGPQWDLGTGEEPVIDHAHTQDTPTRAVPSGRVPPLKTMATPRVLQGPAHRSLSSTLGPTPRPRPLLRKPRPQTPRTSSAPPLKDLGPAHTLSELRGRLQKPRPSRDQSRRASIGAAGRGVVMKEAWSIMKGRGPGRGEPGRSAVHQSVRPSTLWAAVPPRVHSRGRAGRAAMDFPELAEAAERWCGRTPFQLIAAEETERRLDFYADPGVSFYVLCPLGGCGDHFVSARREGGRSGVRAPAPWATLPRPGDLRSLARRGWLSSGSARGPRGPEHPRGCPRGCTPPCCSRSMLA